MSPSVCPDITIDNSPTVLNGIEAGESVTVTCDDTNFILTASGTVTCQEDGLWPGNVPQCDEIGKLI